MPTSKGNKGGSSEGGRAPWDRQPGETAKSFRAFCIYRDMGPSRSQHEAWIQYRLEAGRKPAGGEPPGYFTQWGSQNDWVRRAALYDTHMDRERRRVIEQVRLDAQKEISESALIVARKLIEGATTGEIHGPQFQALKHLLDLAGLDVVRRSEVKIEDGEILALLGASRGDGDE